MRKQLLFFFLFIIIFSTNSCNMSGANPDKIFTKIGLNGNKIPRSFKQHFREIRGQIAHGSLTYVSQDNEIKKGVSATEYVQNRYSNMFDKDIKEIKELASDEESKPIINAGLEMFRYADEIYKTDFPRIAKMIDDGKQDEEIDAEIENLDNTKGLELDKKYNKTMDLLIPYADKHGVKYEMKDYPF